jgi:hypothetical protein
VVGEGTDALVIAEADHHPRDAGEKGLRPELEQFVALE